MKNIKKQYESPSTFICRIKQDQPLLAIGSKAETNDYTQGSGSGSSNNDDVIVHNDPITPGGGEITPARYDAWATWDDLGWE